jgi:hypothetical protein
VSTAGYLALLEQIAGMDVPHDAKELFRSIVEARLRADPPDREARVHLARAQLDAGVSRADICRQICERFGVGKSQAYRDIDAALNLSQRMGNS